VTSAQSGAAAGVIILKEKKIICFVKSFLYQACEKGAPRCSKYFFDHSTVRFTANSKLASQAQTLSLRPFRFTKNGYRKNLNPRSELLFPVFQRFLIFSHQGEARDLNTILLPPEIGTMAEKYGINRSGTEQKSW
jgi:hypothetical protein